MFRIKMLCALSVVAVFGCVPVSVPAQTDLKPLREIKLPVPPSLGLFGSTEIVYGESINEMSSIKVAPDQSLLVLDPNTNGKWLLERVKKWWSTEPASEVLTVKGWSAAESKHSGRIFVDLQITPDGHYAVVFAAQCWMQKFDFIFFAPRGYVQRKPDTIITVIDLERWQVVGSIHTDKFENADFCGARILSNNLMVLQGLDADPSSNRLANVDYRRNRLISIPDLKPGANCTSNRWGWGNTFPKRGVSTAERRRVAENLNRQNNSSCGELLQVSGVESVKTLESLIYKGHGAEPMVLLLHSLGYWDESDLEGDKKQSSVDLDEKEQMEYYDHWNESSDNVTESSSLPVEASSHLWYGLYFSRECKSYNLGKFDADGRKLMEQPTPHLLCEERKTRGWNAGPCGCRIRDLSEEQHTLLAYCRIQRGDFLGMVLKEWITAISTDDLSAVGSVTHPKNRYIHEVLATGDGHAYILTVEEGKTLRVYAVPGHN